MEQTVFAVLSCQHLHIGIEPRKRDWAMFTSTTLPAYVRARGLRPPCRTDSHGRCPYDAP